MNWEWLSYLILMIDTLVIDTLVTCTSYGQGYVKYANKRSNQAPSSSTV